MIHRDTLRALRLLVSLIVCFRQLRTFRRVMLCRRSANARNRYAIASGPEGHGNIIPMGESIGSGGSALS